MLSGNKLKQAYASLMALGKCWLSWNVSEDWVSEHLTDHGQSFLWPGLADPQELNQCVYEIQDLKVLFLLHHWFRLAKIKFPILSLQKWGYLGIPQVAHQLHRGFSIKDKSGYHVWILRHHRIQFVEIKFLLLLPQKWDYSVIPHVVDG